MKFAAGLVVAAGLVSAGPITFTFSADASGTLNGVAFTNAILTFTQVTDTNNVFGPTIFSSLPATGNTVNIAGLGTFMLTDSTEFYDNQNVPNAGVYDATLHSDIFEENDAAFSSYQLKTAIGPVTDTLAFVNQNAIGTSGGALIISSAGEESTFTASTTVVGGGGSSTPEPGSFGLMAAGVSLVGLGLRRRKR